MIHNRDELKECRKKAKADMETAVCRILVCSGTGCIATGSHKIHERFEDLVKETPGIELVFSPCGGHDGETVVGVKKTGCQGFLSRKWKKESLVWKMIMYIIFPSNLGVIKVFEGMSF